MKPTCRKLAASSALLAALATGSVNAFWIVGPVEGHRTITTSALGQVRSATFPHLRFRIKAIDEIVRTNLKTDTPPYHPVDHFDNELFEEAAKRILNQRGGVPVSLPTATKPRGDGSVISRLVRGDQIRAWKLLGTTLHTLQDFYAHSTWVETRERNHDALVPALVFDRTAADRSSMVENFVASLHRRDDVDACLPPDSTELDPANNTTNVIGAYYVLRKSDDKPFVALSNRPYRPEGTVIKCLHLGVTVTCEFPDRLATCGKGTEHDPPFSEVALKARRLATQATLDFVNEIVKDLEAVHTTESLRAVCTLFGADPTLCVEPGTVVVRRLIEVCVSGVPSYRKRDNLSLGVDASNSPVSVCLQPHVNTLVPVLFCHDGVAWMPKNARFRRFATVSSMPGVTSGDSSVDADGTFKVTQQRTHHTEVVSGSQTLETVDDYSKSVEVNMTTGHNLASSHGREDEIHKRPTGETFGRDHVIFSAGGSTTSTSTLRYLVRFADGIYDSFTPDEPIPEYCSSETLPNEPQ